MSSVLVIGGSRGIGLETVKRALAQGFSVKAMSRNVEALDLEAQGLEKVAGDATSIDDVTAALEGVDAVVSALGVPLSPRTIKKPTRFFSSSTTILIEAMQAKGVRRLVAVTGYGAGDSHTRLSTLERIPFTLVFGRIYADKSRQEEAIKGSGLDWTIARPGILTQGARKRTYKVLTEKGSWRNGLIARADVADYIVSAIDNPATVGTSPVLVY